MLIKNSSQEKKKKDIMLNKQNIHLKVQFLPTQFYYIQNSHQSEQEGLFILSQKQHKGIKKRGLYNL